MLFENGVRTITSSITPTVGDTISLVNSNCKFTFDSHSGCFCCAHEVEEFVVDVEIIDVDDSSFEVEFATARILEVLA